MFVNNRRTKATDSDGASRVIDLLSEVEIVWSLSENTRFVIRLVRKNEKKTVTTTTTTTITIEYVRRGMLRLMI